MDHSSASPEHSSAATRRNLALADLIRRMARGDETALAELYDSTSNLVYSLALRILNERGSAEEVVLDIYTQVWRQAGDYDAGRGAPLAWLLTIARTRSVDRLRSGWSVRQRTDPIESAEATPATSVDPEAAAALSERGRIVRAALDELNADQRKAIELAYFGGLSHSEIAELLGEPLGTIKTRIRLAMTRLRERLGPIIS
jgi:RNA polymerase sigma-70 factor (ECF subfamily)